MLKMQQPSRAQRRRITEVRLLTDTGDASSVEAAGRPMGKNCLEKMKPSHARGKQFNTKRQKRNGMEKGKERCTLTRGTPGRDDRAMARGKAFSYFNHAPKVGLFPKECVEPSMGLHLPAERLPSRSAVMSWPGPPTPVRSTNIFPHKSSSPAGAAEDDAVRRAGETKPRKQTQRSSPLPPTPPQTLVIPTNPRDPRDFSW